MTSNARVFFAGIATTFLIIGAGFGGGLMFAKNALHDAPAQGRIVAQTIDPVRVILPTTAEAAQPRETPQQTPPVAEPAPSPVPAVAKASERPVATGTETKKIDDERTRRRKYAERKARKTAVAKMIEARTMRPAEPRIMAFDSDQPATGFFGQ